MKKTQEILGLPIISISDGIEIGKVKSIIVNAEKGAIDYIVVDSGIQILSAKVIHTDKVLGIGEYALTIENDGSINDISRIPAAIDLLQKNIQVKGTKVLTKKGRLIGEIGDIYVDEDNCCKISGLEYIADITQKKVRIIPRDSVITFGKNLVVVKDDVEANLVDSSTGLVSGIDSSEVEKKNLAPVEIFKENIVEEVAVKEEVVSSVKDVLIETPNIVEVQEKDSDEFNIEFELVSSELVSELVNEKTSEPQLVDEVASTVEVVEPPKIQKTETSSADLFEQKQKQYLIGRKASKTIQDNLGRILINSDSIITEELVNDVKQSGKLIELVMNNKA